MKQYWFKHIASFIFVCLLFFSANSQNNNLSDLRVVIEFKSAPISVDIIHTPLKYNKDFALSFTMDDGPKEIYTHAFKILTGGTIDGINYNPLYYTDGCENDIIFTMSAAIYSLSSYNNQDVHEPGSDYSSLNITWPEINEMYQAGFGILNHGLTTATSGDLEYSVGRNHSYIKYKTQDATPGGIHPTIFVNPNGVSDFTIPAFNHGYNAAYRSISYGVDYLNVFTPSSIINLNKLEIGRQLLSGTFDLANFADELYGYSSASDTSPWASVFSHTVTGKYGGVSFSSFKSYLQDIESTYGKEGLDNIWFTSEEEVLNYVLIRDAITVNQETIDNKIHLSFSGITPNDLRTYALSLSIKTNASDTISSVTINGDTYSSFSALNKTEILINAEWDGMDLPSPLEIATLYVDSCESTQSQNIANIAMDYVMLLAEGSDKDNLKYRLCNISGINMPEEVCRVCSTSIGNDTTICEEDCVDLIAEDATSYLWDTGETTQIITSCPDVTTDYSVKVYDEFGCESRDTLTIFVNPLPIPQSSNDTIVCPNNCLKIWVSGGDHYLWDTGETTDTLQICPTEAKKYYVNVYNEFGCLAKDSIFVDVFPAINIDAGKDVTVYQGDCTTLTASGGTSYIWSTGATTSEIEICPTETERFYVTAYDGNSCSETDSVLVILRSAPEVGSASVGVNSIVVLFESNPSFLNVNKTPLKYNKDFALSFHINDAHKDIYTHAFPYLNGGSVDGVNYPGLTFTDGCNNELNFKMGTSLHSFAADGFTDVHDPMGDFTDDFSTWPELIEMYQAGWSIFNQALLPDNSGDAFYSIARNHSFVKYKTYESVIGGIPMTVLMNPEDDNSFSTPAFVQNYRAAFSSYAEGVPYYDISLIPNADSLKMGSNSLDNHQSLAALADLIHNDFNPSTRLWASANISTITDGNALGYSFSVFRFYMDYIENKYGSGGMDNIWMSSEEEVWDYLTIYSLTTIHYELLDNRLLITFSGSLPSNLNNYALSLLIESDANIESVEINGGTENTFKIKSNTSTLINLKWDGLTLIDDVVNAENYVVIAETNRTTNDALIAMDYVNMLDFGAKKEELRNRLCAITEATMPLGYCSCEFSIGVDTIICKDDCIDLIAPDGTSYLWNTEETTQNIEVCPTELSEFWVTVFNKYDCYFTDSIQIEINPDNFADAGLDTTICELSCVDLTASNGSSFLWSNGEATQTINVCPDQETKYYVDVTNAIGCVSKDSVIVSLYDLPIPELSTDVNLCAFDTTILRVSGGISYLWSTGSTTDSIKVSPATTTTYYVWINNENNCQVIDSVKVTVIPLPLADAGIDTAICLGDCITLMASGGYTYKWNTNETSQNIKVCPDDTTTYYVTVKDEFSCASIDSVEVFVKAVPSTQTSNDTIVCPNQCVKIWAKGGTSYLWDTGETTDTIEVCPSEATKYYVSVFNDLNCATVDSVFVNVFPIPDAYAGGNVNICPDNCVTLLATGGYGYLWSTGEETNSIEVCPDATSKYFVTVLNQYGCSSIDSALVILRPLPAVDAGDDVSKCLTDCIELQANGALSYSWNIGDHSQIIEVCPSVETKYFVTGTNQFGCSSTDSVSVKINDYTAVNLLGILPVYCEGASSVLLEGTPANGSFGGSDGVSGNVFSPSNAGIGEHQVYYTVVDNSGCTIADTINVNIYEIPNFTLGDDITLCTDETLELFVTSGFDQYLWSNGNTSGSYLFIDVNKFGLGTTVVGLTVTNSGCVASDEFEITFESCNVGIEDLEDIGINVYPNPNSGIFNISYDGTEANQYFSIFNLQGKEVYTKALTECHDSNCTKDIDVSFLNKGLYLIRFFNEKGIRTAKLIIQ